MTSDIVRTKPLEAAIGLEVVDVDLSQPVDEDVRAELRRLFDCHYFLLFRCQEIDVRAQARALEMTGLSVIDPADDTEYISNRPDNPRAVSLAFHSDMAFLPEPYHANSLYAVSVVSRASATRFASSAHAYRRLPTELKQRINGLETLHVMPLDLSGRNRASTVPAEFLRARHQLAMRHPRTGEAVIYMNWNQIDSIVELEEAESEALIQELCSYLYAPENVFDHYWESGDLVMWDNIAIQHGRADVSDVGDRHLRRLCCGAAGFRTAWNPPDWLPRMGESSHSDPRR